MFTQSTVMFYSFEEGMRTGDALITIPKNDMRYEPLIRDEIKRIEEHNYSTVKEWSSFNPAELVEVLEAREKHWQKLVNGSLNATPWHMDDLTNALEACNTVLWILDGLVDELAPYIYAGPVRREHGYQMSVVAVTQHLLQGRYQNATYLQTQLQTEIMPLLEEAKMEIRARMGNVEVGTNHYCIECGREFEGAEGLVIQNTPRNPAQGVVCLKCFGY